MQSTPSPTSTPLRQACRLALLAQAMLACIPAGAKPPQATPSPPAAAAAVAELDTVVVRHDARRDDTASRTVVTRAELLAFGDGSLAEAMKRLPGVSIGTGAPGSSGAISLRGMGSGYTQLLVDGQAVAPGFDLGALSPEMIERIEILRTTTADLRSAAIAGTINIVLARQARRDSDELKLALGVSNGRHLPSLHWSHSRRDEYRSHSLETSLTRREYLVEETGSEIARDRDGVSAAQRDTRLRVDGYRDALAIAPRFDLTLRNGDTLALQSWLDAGHARKYADIGWTTSLGPQLDHVRYRQFTGTDVVQLRTDLHWSHEFAQAGKLSSKLGLSGNRERSRFREQGYAIDANQNLDDVTDGRLRVHGLSSSGKYALPLSGPDASDSGRHALELGWETGLERRRESRLQHLRAIAGQPETISDLSFDATLRRLALYAQDEWTLSPGWSLYLGARWERIDTRSEGNRFATVRNDASVLSPVLQSLWKLSKTRNDQVRLGLSRSYRAPELRSLIPRPYTSTNNRALNPDQQGNPDLRPELATGLDLAYEKYWDQGAMLSLGVYLREIDGLIRTETRLIDDRWVALPANGGRARTWGVELESKLSLARWFAALPVDLRFNLTRNWSQVDDVPGPHNRIDSQPRLTAALAADYVVNPVWTVGASYSHRSGGPVRTGVHEIESESPRRELDAYASMKLAKRSKLRLSLSNLLEQDLVSGAEYFDEEGWQGTQRRRPTSLLLRAQIEIAL
ncbi:TonB-dependent receptor plug domain-containing protein [Lysobacter antibioticus]|uniref:TonB dependent receptor family protein n=1 Tax=Lysobacter antibioticus TaxID=84531 RepID=A0A0S2FB01_LYSAN|nr:TonB-dependent receptor [Lysobacter antibioticus]ALN80705.1 tonB dependent receptor family protein [Lysobacter antibioticus]